MKITHFGGKTHYTNQKCDECEKIGAGWYLSLCPWCEVLTKTIDGKCGKCKEEKFKTSGEGENKPMTLPDEKLAELEWRNDCSNDETHHIAECQGCDRIVVLTKDEIDDLVSTIRSHDRRVMEEIFREELKATLQEKLGGEE